MTKLNQDIIQKHYDVIIIGGGAAGLMTAIESSKNQKRTLVIEHNKTVGNKILISGGGRCNFTNINAKIDNYISENVDFMRSSFSNYSPEKFYRFS
jgi:predicted flavoprotein YhiN